MTNFEPKNNQKSTEIEQNFFTDFDQNNQILIDTNLLISYFLAIIYFSILNILQYLLQAHNLFQGLTHYSYITLYKTHRGSTAGHIQQDTKSS